MITVKLLIITYSYFICLMFTFDSFTLVIEKTKSYFGCQKIYYVLLQILKTVYLRLSLKRGSRNSLLE